MATEEQVRQARAENEALREQIRQARAKQAADVAAANNDISLERQERERVSLEAELAQLMGTRVSGEVSTVPNPNTLLVGEPVSGEPVKTDKSAGKDPAKH